MGGLSESAVIMAVVRTGLGKTLHRSHRNAENLLIKRRAFRLVLPDGGLLVCYGTNWFSTSLAFVPQFVGFSCYSHVIIFIVYLISLSPFHTKHYILTILLIFIVRCRSECHRRASNLVFRQNASRG